MKQRVYIDTSVIGGCFDEEFKIWSNQFFDEVRKGHFIVLISDITYRELELAPQVVQYYIQTLPNESIESLTSSPEVDGLAARYIEAGAISSRFSEDARHIAIATIEKSDILISWNFKHIVNLEKIRKYNAINMMHGYRVLEIRTPREILKESKNENKE